ncbi:MAG: polysaccharide deacetylase family protein [Actinobacteria bacterium]|nr:polysaccharide deacetylase family protein [Actinomycetota bacterium]
MRYIDRLRTYLPDWLDRDELRRRMAAAPWLRAAPPRHLKDLVGPTNEVPSAIALTFDDGPDRTITPQLLQVLADHDAHATFFMCGRAAIRHPDVVRAVVAAGHSVGAHGWDHRPVRWLPPREWDRQIVRPLEALGALTGRPVRWFRPPWGAVDRSTVAALRRRGVTTMLWSADGLDWQLDDPTDIADSALRHLDAGGVVLLHDAVGDLLREDATAQLPSNAHADRSATVAATELLLRRLRSTMTLCGLDALKPRPLRYHTSARLPRRRPGIRQGDQARPVR